MRIVSTSYSKTEEFKDPVAWLHRIGFYTGILEQLAMKHEVYSIERIDYSGDLIHNSVHYHFIEIGGKVIYFPRKMHQYIAGLEPDIVLVNGFIFPLQLIQLKKAVGRQTKIVVIHRSELPATGWRRPLQRWASRSVDAFLFTSSAFGDEWIKKGNITGSHKIHEVMHASSIFTATAKPVARAVLALDASPVYLWVGRLDNNKDPLTVVRAFKKFLDHQPLAKLYMIYHHSILEEEVKKEIVGCNNIIMVGRIEHSTLQDWYNGADFFISGSHYEGGGIAACEAMSCGCIPILTNIPSFAMMTANGACGLLYEAGNENALLQTLKSTLDMDIPMERAKVLKHFQQELSFAAIAGKMVDLFNTLQR